MNGGIGGSRGVDVRADEDDHRVMSFIVAARSEITVETLYRTFAQAIEHQPRSTWPNGIATAGAWYLAYDVPSGRPRTSLHIATGVRIHEVSQKSNIEPLVDVAHDLWSWLRVAPLVDVRPNLYMRPSTTAWRGPIPDAPKPTAVAPEDQNSDSG